ncbi:MAG: hypothetical protein RJA44_399 [Pseudomonadota bacterium]
MNRTSRKSMPPSKSSPTDTDQAAAIAVGTPTGEADLPLFVVGIGASAGGLDALEKLFAGIPPDTGAAFVVIQHLSPDHKSMMASLLGRHTQMELSIVEQQDTPIKANAVYLIPPGQMMHMRSGHLHLTMKSTRSLMMPIDVFFQSMAREQGQNCMGVILSGTGSDGTRGLVSINEAGGFLLVQDPENAKFDGMPRSAIATGLVDDILPIEQLSARIAAHIRGHHEHGGMAQPARDNETDSREVRPEDALTQILHILTHVGGINFEEYKPGTVLRRIERRMAVRQVRNLYAYLQLCIQERTEVMTLRRDMLISVTSFFRDIDAYTTLAELVIKPLVERRETGQPIRVWSAGVSTGEEPYTLAMIFHEVFEQTKRWPALKIFATDVEQSNIDSGSAGSYPESIAAELSPERLERFFDKRGNRYVVRPEIRQSVVFARHNLLSDPPFTRMDLVVCRNTLIYFRTEAQEKALNKLQYALSPKGYLFLGPSESLGEQQSDFQLVSVRQKIWQLLRPGSAPLDFTRKLSSQSIVSMISRQPEVNPVPRMGSHAVEQGYQQLLQSFSPPPAVLVSSNNELVHAYGDVSRYVQIRPGQLSLEVPRILIDTLVPVATALLFKAMREGSSVTSDPVRLPSVDEAEPGGKVHNFVRLSAIPAGDAEGRHTLLVFEPLRQPIQSNELAKIDVSMETSQRIEALEHELNATREALQAAVEELETSNEELQATNEEMMASNEELQSSNEELQSVNEELNTVNAEYQEKIDILNRINADLDNLTKVVAAGTIFVDEQLRLVRYSTEASKIFRLRDGDLGRPLDDLKHILRYDDLSSDLQRTLRTGELLERDISGEEGRHFMVRMLPYHIPSASTSGVVLSFVEVTSLHQAVERLRLVLDGMPTGVIVLDDRGLVTQRNSAMTNLRTHDALRPLLDVGIGVNLLDHLLHEERLGSSEAPKLLAQLRQVLSGETQTTSFQVDAGEGADQPTLLLTRVDSMPPAIILHHSERSGLAAAVAENRA